MAEIGYGYGSEFQLMRFLGHHRELLEKKISMALNESGTFHWLDFEFNSPRVRISGDKELQGLSFLSKLDYPKSIIKTTLDEYKKTGINKLSSWQSWDAIFTLDGTLYLVEAKARIEEMKSPKENNGGGSKSKIRDFFKKNLQENMKYQIPIDEEWFGEYYQLANRLATAAFLNNQRIKTRVLYIYFINGYNIRIFSGKRVVDVYDKMNATRLAFEEAISEEMMTLHISDNENINLLLAPPVFINAEYDE